MNVVAAIRFYIKKMTDESGAGMKILLLDQETVNIFCNFIPKFNYSIQNIN
jgi:hypothetical protein